MPSTDPALPFWSTPPQAAAAQVVALAEQVGRMLAVAGALAASRRRVELDGLQNNVGLLCAKALDLCPTEARLIRVELIRLVAGLDALAATMRGRRT